MNFVTIDNLLLERLRTLAPEDWDRPTIAGQWKVRHVAAHLLDTALRRLSLGRDRYFTESPGDDLAAFIHRVNQRGVETYGRLSPRVLISLLETATRELAAHMTSLDPQAPAEFPVSWAAGEEASKQWFDTAREYTERWHHQQQIRIAVDPADETILARDLYYPVLDCFLQGVQPQVAVEISGDVWGPPASQTTIHIPGNIAWRVFTKGIARDEAAALCRIEGPDRDLALQVLTLRAIIS